MKMARKMEGSKDMKRMKHDHDKDCYAAGGAAKVRKGVATKSGKLVEMPKSSYKKCMK